MLERVFRETYGIELKDTFGSLDLAIGTYRRSVSKIIPEMTRVALLSKRADIVRDTPNFSEKKFLYHLLAPSTNGSGVQIIKSQARALEY